MVSDELDFYEMTQKNKAYYDRFALDVAKRSEKRDYARAYQTFLTNLPKDGTLIDIGCGTGLHLQHFCNLGIPAMGVDPSSGMRAVACASGLNVVDGMFETIDTITLPKISGIWCAASLIHVPQNMITTVLTKLSSLLPQGAPLFFTVRLGDEATWDRFDDESGDLERYIQFFSEEKLHEALQSASLQIVDKWIEDSLWGRSCRWISIVARRRF